MKRRLMGLGLLFSWMFLVTAFCGPLSAQAGEPVVGKTYDKSNWQEIQEYLPKAVGIYLKDGDFVISVSKLNFEHKVWQPYKDLTAKNEGKFDFNADGMMIDKVTGQVPEYIVGNPFPTIDEKDPKVAMKIMENNAFSTQYRVGSGKQAAQSKWVGQGGLERQIISSGFYFYFQNRVGKQEQVKNPNNFLKLNITGVYEPYDLRGTTSMAWSYNDGREDTSFAYVPMLRRVRRSSAAARSDPHMGSDGCMDDAYGYCGKNAAMTFKYLGKKDCLVAIENVDKKMTVKEADGRCQKNFTYLKVGYHYPDWKGAPWATVDAKWVVRPIYLIEMYPKDPYYNYGTQILYIDRENWANYNKEVYDRAGSFWKNIMVVWSYETCQDGEDMTYTCCYHQIDSKSRHAGVSHPIPHDQGSGLYRLPLKELNPDNFTASSLIQMSK